MIPQVVKWIRFLAETIHVGFKTTFCKSKIKKISVSAFDWYRKPGISGEKANETVHHGRNVSEKKKSKTLQGIINFSQFYWNDRKFPVPLLYVDYKCQASTRAIAKNLTFFFFSLRRMPNYWRFDCNFNATSRPTMVHTCFIDISRKILQL